MKALVIGGNSYIGSELVKSLSRRDIEVITTTRETCDLLNLPFLPEADIVYICAAVSKFSDCETNPLSYRINVDAPLEIAKRFNRVVYLSSNAVEVALHTNYGMHKALAELGLRTVCNPIIVRLSRVSADGLHDCCEYLASMTGRQPGVYHWP